MTRCASTTVCRKSGSTRVWQGGVRDPRHYALESAFGGHGVCRMAPAGLAPGRGPGVTRVRRAVASDRFGACLTGPRRQVRPLGNGVKEE